MKHYYKTEKGFKTIEVKPPPVGELMLTQLSTSQRMQSYPVLKHSHTNTCMSQGSWFYTLSVEKDGDDFYIKVMDNWFIKYEGVYREAVNQDYLFHQQHKKLVQKALEVLDEKIYLVTRAKDGATLPKRPRPKAKRKRAKPTAKEVAKRVAKRGKLLQKIAVDKYNKQKHVSTKRR